MLVEIYLKASHTASFETFHCLEFEYFQLPVSPQQCAGQQDSAQYVECHITQYSSAVFATHILDRITTSYQPITIT